MHKNADLKESIESLRFEYGFKSKKESEQGECVSNGCKTNNALTIFMDAKVGARWAKTLVACTNSSTRPKVKLRPKRHKRMP
jgi:hypothetical protein